MEILFRELIERATAQGPQGELLLLINGDESTEDLKELILQLTNKCPVGKGHLNCPFQILSGLTPASIAKTVQALSRESCLQLFEMERECRMLHPEECKQMKDLLD